MAMDAWILSAPLKVLRREDHPYQETTLATLGRHELGLCRRDTGTGPGCELFLDGHSIFHPGAPAPSRAWFELCRELGYEPARHWDWDPALILFQQVIPALAADWHEPPLVLNDQGLPEGLLTLAGLRQAFAEAVAGLRRAQTGPVGAKVAETFEWLPLRAVVFHDDAQLPLDFEGTGPSGRVSLLLGIHRDRPVIIEGLSPAPTSRRWLVEDLHGRQDAATYLAAAGLDPEPPKGFEAALQRALDRLSHWMEAPLDAYRRTYPVGISWHHGRREGLVGRTIVEVRTGDQPVLILDDGTEVALSPEPLPTWEHGGI
ncbi:hypothetical protein [Geothrix sp. PMB-07]|uniref:hypothetical protein n=1 Tax=Geothrix sp. PMB-07 TaxID=3068640 RepID=UPI0027425144|nr:hypothetical protein [Geothrix sp. PMB-07]WLT32648.1 hypothetical protein Q9293_04785 [Geothrix sp. PMB-07]